ncbi:MAG: flagellar motor protein MotB [Armatimonadetes bacterium]|nr:flagellar motor protein MotB [Armatimonadota bacterium]
MAGKKKKSAGGHDNEERWLLTYADMITLLVAFFMMLYSMSIVNNQKFHDLALSVRGGFGGVLTGGGPSPFGGGSSDSTKPDIAPQGMDKSSGLVQTEKLVNKYIQDKKLKEALSVHEDERGLVITLATDHVLFDMGSADIKPKIGEVLDKIGKLLKGMSNHIRVEGHTCNLPVRNAQFHDNFRLSMTRASNVYYYLIRSGISPDRLAATGYADTRPLALNTSDANRAKNRRVDIVILNAGEAARPEGDRASNPGKEAGHDRQRSEEKNAE